MIRALRGDNIEEPVERPKAESRMARVERIGDHFYLTVAGQQIYRGDPPATVLFKVSALINAEVDKRCREAVKAELDRLRGLVHRI